MELLRWLKWRIAMLFSSEDYVRGDIMEPGRKRINHYRQHLEVGNRVLDVGTGSGILAKLALEKGAREVVAVDINPQAIQIARARVPEAKVLESNLFEKVQGRFDTIIFAAPWSEGEKTDLFDHAVFDDGVVARFFRQAKDYLADGGSIWLGYSDESEANFQRLHESIQTHGYRVDGSWSYPSIARYKGNRRIHILLYRIRVARSPSLAVAESTHS